MTGTVGKLFVVGRAADSNGLLFKISILSIALLTVLMYDHFQIIAFTSVFPIPSFICGGSPQYQRLPPHIFPLSLIKHLKTHWII